MNMDHISFVLLALLVSMELVQGYESGQKRNSRCQFGHQRKDYVPELFMFLFNAVHESCGIYLLKV
jgi:hypothetical protein